MSQLKLLFVMPVYNDWEACALLLQDLDQVASEQPDWEVEVLAINDGSTDPLPPFRPALQAIEQVSVLMLKRNLGHQRAICTGLCYALEHLPFDAIVVLDADGQDSPEAARRLIEHHQQDARRPVVFAARQKRSERMLFRVFYQLYKALHVFLTGHTVRVGNFSVISKDSLRSLTLVPEMWSHYAASVFISKLPRIEIPVARKPRAASDSKMNFVSLVSHGLGAISAFGELVGVRMLVGSGVLGLVLVMALTLMSGVALLSGWGLSECQWIGALVAGGLLLQSAFIVFVFAFALLASRKAYAFIPIRDSAIFIDQALPWKPSSNRQPINSTSHLA